MRFKVKFSMAKILIVLARSPFPDFQDGISLRMNALLKYLSSRHSIDLIIACDTSIGSNVRADEARRYCDTVVEFCPANRHRIFRLIRLAIGIFDSTRAPYDEFKDWSADLAQTVRKNIYNINYDVVLWTGFFSDAASVLFSMKNVVLPRVVMEWTDSIALHLERGTHVKSRLRNCFFKKFRVEKLKSWERYINSNCNAAIYTTLFDAEFANSSFSKNIYAIPNGVLHEKQDQIERSCRRNLSMTLGFLGNMGYKPNIISAIRLYERIFIPLKKEYPDLKMKIIGRNPATEIALLSSEDIIVTGTVESIWPHIFDTDIFVFPMVTGAGLQNKLLEAMIASKPIVASPICVAGLDGEAHNSLLTADSDSEFYRAVRELINSPSQRIALGEAAHQYVARYSWQAILPIFEKAIIGH
jgi:glycosyltransferase involved in cell wall biosynthesis